MSGTAIYCRVSTDEQAKKGTSIPAQREACRAYAAQHGYAITVELIDEESGAHSDRPGMTRLRELIAAGAIGRVIVWRQDRLARDELGYFTLRAEFRRHNVEVHAVNRGGKVDGLYAALEAVLDADERERIQERTTRGRRQKAERGRIIGNGPPPYGYIQSGERDAITWTIDEPRAATVRRIFTMHTQALLSPRQIAQRLTDEQIPSPSDARPEVRRKRPSRSWTRETIRWMLRNPAYAGTFYAYRTAQPLGETSGKRPPLKQRPREDWIPIPVPAIVDQATFDAAQQRLDRGQALAFRNTKHEYLVGRRIRCACGHAATASTTSMTERNPRAYAYYTCNRRRDPLPGTDRCTMPLFRGDVVDDLVWTWLRDEVLHVDRLRDAIQKRAQQRAEQQQPDDQQAQLQQQRAALVAQRGRIDAAYVAGAYTLEEYLPWKRETDTKLADLDRQLAALTVATAAVPNADQAVPLVEALAHEYADVLTDAPFALRRFLVDKFDVTVRMELRDDDQWIVIRANALDLETAQKLP